MTKTFFIIEDHSLMRHGIATWLSNNTDWECVGTAENKDEAISKLSSLSVLPAVIITDINLGSDSDDYSGINLIKEACKTFPDTKCICYSMFKSPGLIKMAMDSGALGYVSKNAGEKELLECMEQAFMGNKYVEKSLNQAVITYNNEVSSLTKREQSVLDLIIQHKSNEDISRILGVQKRAVETYTSRLYDKTGCANRQELIDMFN